jgi:D-alanine-D-alanine ligase
MRVAVLRGGPSNEYDVSMKSGANVLRALEALGYTTKDIVITRKGEWLENGRVRKPEQSLEAVDVVFIALHGSYGEDGTVQRLLQTYRIPFTGSNALSSNIAFNKILTKDTVRSSGISLPGHYKLTSDDISRLHTIVPELNRMLGEELFVKPIAGGSSLGASYIANQELLLERLGELLREYGEVMVEEFIRGKEATVAVLENFRDQPLYVLPVVEIIPPSDDPIFSYENKYNGRTNEICPGRFSYHEKAKLEDSARRIHEVLRCNHYSRSDFIVRDGEVYFLEINTLPGLTSESLLPKAASAIGLTYNELIEHLVRTAKW